MHAKSQLIWAIRLARAMGVVRKLTTHLILGGNLYIIYVVETNDFLLFFESVTNLRTDGQTLI